MICCVIIQESKIVPKLTGVVVGDLEDIWFLGLYKYMRVGKKSYASSTFLLTR
jgi:hypothetical protein